MQVENVDVVLPSEVSPSPAGTHNVSTALIKVHLVAPIPSLRYGAERPRHLSKLKGRVHDPALVGGALDFSLPGSATSPRSH